MLQTHGFPEQIIHSCNSYSIVKLSRDHIHGIYSLRHEPSIAYFGNAQPEEYYTYDLVEESVAGLVVTEQPAFIALVGNQVRGFAAAYDIDEPREGEYEIGTLVSEHARRLGIGTTFLTVMEWWGRMNSMHTMNLRVMESNHGALSLYRNFGFEERRIGLETFTRRGNFPGDPSHTEVRIPVVHMQKRIGLRRSL